MNNPNQLNTGGDPRTLPDHAALRNELNKLSHPARPDVDWRYAEKLCLSLFEQNGVELQTAASYTFIRTQLSGMSGLNEGLSILEALISHQWSVFWPQPVHARMEILSNLCQRLQQQMRSLSLDYSDLGQLYAAEQSLTRLGAVLQRLELKHLSQIDILRSLMHSSAVRLENSHDAPGSSAAFHSGNGVTATVINNTTLATNTLSGDAVAEHNQPDTVKWVYVVQQAHTPDIKEPATIPAPENQWKVFAAGMCTMLMVSAVTVWSWQYLHQPDPLEAQLAASLSPIPIILTRDQLNTLRQQYPSPQSFIADTQQQLVRLSQLPPDWNIAYSRQLVDQAQVLWPEHAKPLAQQWQRQLDAASIPAENLNSWRQGMTRLQLLSDRLSRLDEQKGKYMTVSELKSVVFSTLQSFNQSIPAEEQLRALSQTPEGQPLPSAAKAQVEINLKQLLAFYTEIKERSRSEI